MPRTFAYVRVSTPGQTTDNQLGEVQAAGFGIEPRRVVTETVSGSVAAVRRGGFARLLDRLEAGDVLVVTKLADLGVRVYCLALGVVDLTSSTGKLTMNMINAVAEFERDLLSVRSGSRVQDQPPYHPAHQGRDADLLGSLLQDYPTQQT